MKIVEPWIEVEKIDGIKIMKKNRKSLQNMLSFRRKYNRR